MNIKVIIAYFFCLTLFGCNHQNKEGSKKSSDSTNNRTSVDTNNHFYSLIDKAQFDTLTGGEFTWEVYRPINDTISFIRFRDRNSFIQKLFAGQKALFYIMELEGAVQQGNSGFSNFYYNYKENYPKVISSLNLIKDTAMLNVMYGANRIYLLNNKRITQDYHGRDWRYTKKQFSIFDNAYNEKHENTMKLLESYIRQHADEFVKIK